LNHRIAGTASGCLDQGKSY